MSVNQKEKIPGYYKKMWFSRIAITNIIAIKKPTEKYRVTYNSNDQMFIVHREEAEKPNTESLMHDSGLNYYEPTKNDLSLLKTLSKNKEGFRIYMSMML